jgi:hypothetical protein
MKKSERKAKWRVGRVFTVRSCLGLRPSSVIPFLTGGGAPCYTLNSSGKLSEVCISSHAPPDGSWKGYVFSDRTDERTHLAEPH